MNVMSKSGRISVTTGPIDGSKKVYVKGERYADLRVPMREIELEPTALEPPMKVYDTSGPYTDPTADIDIEKGSATSRNTSADA